MTTRYLTSDDGLAWTDRGEVLAGRPGEWDARGARVITVIGQDPLTVCTTAGPTPSPTGSRPRASPSGTVSGWWPTRVAPIASPYGDGAFRYASAVPLADGRTATTSRPPATTARTTW